MVRLSAITAGVIASSATGVIASSATTGVIASTATTGVIASTATTGVIASTATTGVIASTAITGVIASSATTRSVVAISPVAVGVSFLAIRRWIPVMVRSNSAVRARVDAGPAARAAGLPICGRGSLRILGYWWEQVPEDGANDGLGLEGDPIQCRWNAGCDPGVEAAQICAGTARARARRHEIAGKFRRQVIVALMEREQQIVKPSLRDPQVRSRRGGHRDRDTFDHSASRVQGRARAGAQGRATEEGDTERSRKQDRDRPSPDAPTGRHFVDLGGPRRKLRLKALPPAGAGAARCIVAEVPERRREFEQVP